MNQRDFEALQRDFAPLLSAADFALLVAEVDAAPTSFARCNVIANWRKWTHHAREAQIVEAHAVDGVLYGWSEVVEPVRAVERIQPTWWKDVALWEIGGQNRSAVEFAALLSILGKAYVRTVQEIIREVMDEKRKTLPLRELLAKRGLSREAALRELEMAA